MRNEFETKPNKCPNCGTTTIIEIRYVLIRPTPEQKQEINDGKWVMGGCLLYQGAPEWVCKTCNTEMYKPYKKKGNDTNY